MSGIKQSFRVGVVQHNPTIGDITGNATQLSKAIAEAGEAGADLVVTPELSILGYPPGDLLHRDGVIEAQHAAIEVISEETEDGPAVVIGVTLVSSERTGQPLQNVALVLDDGEISGSYTKRLLPTYDIFDEHRYFDPGSKPETVEVAGVTVGLSICEDAWHDDVVEGSRRHASDPLGDLAAVGADCIVNISASPFSLDKPRRRAERFAAHAERTGVPIVFANQAGANDDLLFDGTSLVVDGRGRVCTRLAAFEPDTAVVPLGNPNKCDPQPVEELAWDDWSTQARNGIVRGIRDYFSKTGFEEAVIGLSGGIDSSVTAALATGALGPDAVYGLSLPSTVTSEASVEDARRVAESLGIEFDVVPIETPTDELTAAIETGTDEEVAGLAAENVQARIRGALLMTIANTRNALVLTPDNKSESAVGYCTLYGDTVGALAPLGDCYKTLVYDIADGLNESPPVGNSPVIPEDVIEKPPTAELKEGQTDRDDLPAYEQLDEILREYIHTGRSASGLTTRFSPAVVDDVLTKLTRSEFKRHQTPPALRITDKAFDRGWRYPIAASYEGVTDW